MSIWKETTENALTGACIVLFMNAILSSYIWVSPVRTCRLLLEYSNKYHEIKSLNEVSDNSTPYYKL
jgi:hypothetical protein